MLIALAALDIFPIFVSATEFSIGFGNGDESITAFRVSSFQDWNKSWTISPLWSLKGFWEISLSSWKSHKGNNTNNDTITALAVAPVFIMQYQGLPFIPYFQAGIGASWLSDTEIGRKKLSTHFQFEDRVGIGIRLGKQKSYDINITAFHFSNGSIQRPNNGVNIVLLNLAYRL